MFIAVVCLSVQVYNVFALLCPAMGLRLGLASGKLPLALEAEVLVNQSAGDEPCCAVDLLVATPGRLMSHLQGTPGMHLDGLKMLVYHRMPCGLTTPPHCSCYATPCATQLHPQAVVLYIFHTAHSNATCVCIILHTHISLDDTAL